MSLQPASETESAGRLAIGLNRASTVTVDQSRKRKAPDSGLADHDSGLASSSTCDVAASPSSSPLLGSRRRPDYLSQPPDFAQLGRLYPFFAVFLQHRGHGRRPTLDFRDPLAIAALTRVLLLHDFQLLFALPSQHLCPPLPQRLAVLYWLDELLSQPPSSSSAAVPRRGVDVGCGASVIFPLLGVRAFGWQFVGTEVDESAVAAARHNVQLNGLQSAIAVREVADRRQLLVGVLTADDGHFDFVICNPPFFSSPAEAQLSPHRTSAATQSELCCEGGELSFVRRLYDDSVQLRRRVDWFACMIGKRRTLTVLRAELAKQQQQQSSAARGTAPCQIRTTSFVQGKQTRWGLAWTFNPMLPQPSGRT